MGVELSLIIVLCLLGLIFGGICIYMFIKIYNTDYYKNKLKNNISDLYRMNSFGNLILIQFFYLAIKNKNIKDIIIGIIFFIILFILIITVINIMKIT